MADLVRGRLPATLFPDTVLTRLADWTGRAPPWGMARDQVQTLRHGLKADGSKAERELGLAYTPIRRAVEEAVASLR